VCVNVVAVGLALTANVGEELVGAEGGLLARINGLGRVVSGVKVGACS
jgi:hypothetical protein